MDDFGDLYGGRGVSVIFSDKAEDVHTPARNADLDPVRVLFRRDHDGWAADSGPIFDHDGLNALNQLGPFERGDLGQFQ